MTLKRSKARALDTPQFIEIKGAREHNLKNISLSIPRGRLTVITGVSGSGKSSLAFDTLYAEGYRKYIESLSAKARQLLDQVKKPEVDYIRGLSPVISIEQRGVLQESPRSTVASTTEIADYARLLWLVSGLNHCPKDGSLIEQHTIDDCIERLLSEPEGSRVILLAPFPEAKGAVIRDLCEHWRNRGFSRVRIEGEFHELADPLPPLSKNKLLSVQLVIDRLILKKEERSRLADSLELAFKEGKNQALALLQAPNKEDWQELFLSQHLACKQCNSVYEPLTLRHLSFNHPEGACPTCNGLGEALRFMPELVVPDPQKSIQEGAIKAWRIGSRGMIIERRSTLRQLAEQWPFDLDTPWKELEASVKKMLLYGSGKKMVELKMPWGKKAAPAPFKGVLEDLNHSFCTTSSDVLRARLMTYQVKSTCPDCQGGRFSARARFVLLGGESIESFFQMDVGSALGFLEGLETSTKNKVLVQSQEAYEGLVRRLQFLKRVGLSYLTLGRAANTLSGGEAQRVRLAGQLGMGLMGVTYVLDEPSVGLHPADHNALLDAVLELRDRGSTVVVVEHDEKTMALADHLVELGPGAGALGGSLIFEGDLPACKKSKVSRTGRYLSGKIKVNKEGVDRRPDRGFFEIKGAYEHNLKHLDVAFPYGLMTTVCGVSGSGKSTLVTDILGAAAAFTLNKAKTIPGKHKEIIGLKSFERLVKVDQEPIGQSPRSNPATYVKLFDLLRTLYSQCPLSKVRGYGPGRFSFNVRGGRCERCQGDGVIRLDMHFLDDVYVECPSCQGERYNRETLEVRFKGLNIAELLRLTVDEASQVFEHQPKIAAKLRTLQAVGLGYLHLGQSANTLSGGESQRIKLALELSKPSQGSTLYILDEPTTGLHWDDVQKLMDLLFKLRDAGNTIVIVEHNLDVIRLSDWIIELGPKGGIHGGSLIYEGPPSEAKTNKQSLTGQYL